MGPRRIIIGTCALDKCTNNEGLITIDQRYDLINVKGGYSMYHPECNPNPETTETTETAA